MFTRREIQRSVNELAEVVSRRQVELLVQRLNAPTREQISAEWEAIALAAFARIADLKHEFDSGGSSRPDIRAVFRDHPLEVVADICAPSDADMEDDNPVERFNAEMFALARELGLTGAGLFLNVERVVATDPKQRRLLALPSKGDVRQFVRLHLSGFLKKVAAQPSVDHSMSHDDGLAHFTLRYEAKETRFSGGGWATYTWPRTPKHNPLYRALDKKAAQLRKSGFSGLKGVIACDAGCESFNGTPDSIVRAFFNQHKHTASFVVLVDVPDSIPGSRGGRAAPMGAFSAYLPARLRLFWNARHDDPRRSLVEAATAQLLEAFPRAARASRYARNRALTPNLRYYNSHAGAYMIESSGSREIIRVSSRAVLGALAGDIRHRPELFPSDYEIPVRIFQAQLREGRLIKSVRLERDPDSDDDWIVLEFDDRDAAASPFQVPAIEGPR